MLFFHLYDSHSLTTHLTLCRNSPITTPQLILLIPITLRRDVRFTKLFTLC